MKRVALLGATGSIGRQAIEIVEAHPGLELCAAASGSSPLDHVDAPLKQVGGDLTALLDAAEPDIVLNAVVGFAGIHATIWALAHGVDLALANKESLVAGGELAQAAWSGGGAHILPVDSEHSAIFQCLEGRRDAQVHSLVLTGSGGPFRGRTREELLTVSPEEALAHPTWRMGPKITVDSATLANKGLELIEAHFLFGLAYEQIEVVLQPTSIVHSLVRFRDGATLAHLGYPDMRVPISFALTYPERAATPLRVQRGERGGRCGVPRGRPAVSRHRRGGRRRARARRRRARARHGRPRRGGCTRARLRRREASGPVTWLVVSVGLLLLVFLHELGHFSVALAVGIRPRSFYVGFPPAIAKVRRNGIEYGIGAIPFGGLVRIPGMHRPSPRDLEAFTATALREKPELAPYVQRVRRSLDVADYPAARAALPELRRALDSTELSGAARRTANRALREVDEATGDDAYWRAPTWKRISVIAAGPAMNLIAAFVIFFAVYATGAPTGNATTRIGEVERATPAAAAGLHASDRIVAVNGVPATTFAKVSQLIRGSHGRPITVTVERAGKTVTLGPKATIRSADGRWIWGFIPATERVSYPVGHSARLAVNDCWQVVTGTAHAFGALFHKKERGQLTSAVGIVRVSQQALKVGFSYYLQIVGLVSMSLALLNLLPFLPLDGGHILFSVIERLRRRAVAREVYERVSAVGFALILLLTFIALSNDLGGSAPR
jgi:1-deoxy-D-xylulose-5-phosphate reductoisomerase